MDLERYRWEPRLRKFPDGPVVGEYIEVQAVDNKTGQEIRTEGFVSHAEGNRLNLVGICPLGASCTLKGWRRRVVDTWPETD